MQVVGSSSVYLNQSLVRLTESNLGNLVCDSLMDYARTKARRCWAGPTSASTTAAASGPRCPRYVILRQRV